MLILEFLCKYLLLSWTQKVLNMGWVGKVVTNVVGCHPAIEAVIVHKELEVDLELEEVLHPQVDIAARKAAAVDVAYAG